MDLTLPARLISQEFNGFLDYVMRNVLNKFSRFIKSYGVFILYLLIFNYLFKIGRKRLGELTQTEIASLTLMIFCVTFLVLMLIYGIKEDYAKKEENQNKDTEEQEENKTPIDTEPSDKIPFQPIKYTNIKIPGKDKREGNFLVWDKEKEQSKKSKNEEREMEMTLTRILVVDDEKTIRSTIKFILESENYDVDEAKDGIQCLNKLKEENYDLIIMDIKMPQLDGISAISEIGKINANIPIILISGHADVDTAIQAVKKGAFDFLSKPIPLERLLITVKNAIEKSNILFDLRDLKKNAKDEAFSFEVEVVENLRIYIQQYILFFKDYLKNIKGLIVEIAVLQIENGIEINIKESDEKSLRKIEGYLSEYLTFVKYSNLELKLKFEREVPINMRDIYYDQINNQIHNFRQGIDFSNRVEKLIGLQNSKTPKGLISESFDSIDVSNEEIKRKYKLDIGEGNLINVLKIIIENNESTDAEMLNDLLVLQGQLNNLIRDSGKGLIPYEEEVRQKNRIANSLLIYIDKIDLKTNTQQA